MRDCYDSRTRTRGVRGHWLREQSRCDVNGVAINLSAPCTGAPVGPNARVELAPHQLHEGGEKDAGG
jgi:hypothetical protein